MIRRNRTFLMMSFVLVLAFEVPAVRAGINWIGTDGGTVSEPLDWNDAANWTGGNVPGAGQIVTFPDSPTGRVVTTSTTVASLTAIGLTQSSSAVNRVMLGGDLTLAGGNFTAGDRSWNNTSGSADNLVLDLNGHVLIMTTGALPVINGPMTISSTAPGGVIRHNLGVNLHPASAGAGWPALKVGPNVTLEAEGAVPNKGVHLANAGTWDESTTLFIRGTAPAGLLLQALPAGGIGNLIVGDPSRTEAANVIGVGSSQHQMIVKRDVTLNPSSGNVAAGFNFNHDATELRVGGNWTDTGGSAAGYGVKKGLITFNGGSDTPRTVSIERTGVITNFAVGDSAGVPGYVALGRNLTTAGSFTVRAGSRLNLADKTLTVGRFASTAGMILDVTCGGDATGGVSVTDPAGLTLAAFTLNITRAGNWNDGDSLVLFRYSGPPITAPTLSLGDIPPGFSFDAVTTDNGQVCLTNARFSAAAESSAKN